MHVHKLKPLIALVAASMLFGCASRQPGNIHTLSGLESLRGKQIKENDPTVMNTFRENALKEMATSISAQSGLAARAKVLNAELEKNAPMLDRVFNFHALILDHNVMSPVLLEGRSTLNIADPSTIRVADRSYQVIKQAHFVSAPPSWRDYLWLDFKPPEKPVNALLPKNTIERRAWKEAVQKGWAMGIKQADDIFSENLAKLKQDLIGMLTYRKLLAQGMVSKPHVARTELGVTGNEYEMRINDQVLRISALPSLEPKHKSWKPAIQQ